MAIKTASKAGSLNVQIKKAQVSVAEKADSVEQARDALAEEKQRLSALQAQKKRGK